MKVATAELMRAAVASGGEVPEGAEFVKDHGCARWYKTRPGGLYVWHAPEWKISGMQLSKGKHLAISNKVLIDLWLERNED